MRGRRIVGIVCCVVGAIWILQGIDLLQGSFMTGQGIWAVFGVAMVVLGAALLRGSRSRSDSS